MSSNLTRRLTPEEQELEKKQGELSALETDLVQRELDLATLQAELHAFEREYLQVIGVRYAELDEVEAEIAKYSALLNSLDSEARKRAKQAWTKAQDSKQAVNANTPSRESSKDFKPPERLKKLYREVAKRLHPDLTTDEMKRQRRQALMVEANQAYEDGEDEQLEVILQRWENSPEAVQGEGVVAELIRSIRKIAQVRERLKEIEAEIEAARQQTLYQLREKAVITQQKGQDLLAEMATQIDEQITAAKVQQEKLRVQLGV